MGKGSRTVSTYIIGLWGRIEGEGMKRFFILLLVITAVLQIQAATVDTVVVRSMRMNKDIKAVVVSPNNQKAKSTLYLLHGYSGNYASWLKIAPHIKELVDTYGYMVVCPDGGFDSWYWDTQDTNYQYESFITKELIPFVEQRYKVASARTNRAITGLSMGGHGALYLAFRHQDLFAFAGSTSGGVDIRPFPNNWSIRQRLGDYRENPAIWDAHTVTNLTHLIQPKSLRLFIDCGTEDFFFNVNNKLHEELTYRNIPHHYLTMPGGHNDEYWAQSIDFQMAFFAQCFADEQAKN